MAGSGKGSGGAGEGSDGRSGRAGVPGGECATDVVVARTRAHRYTGVGWGWGWGRRARAGPARRRRWRRVRVGCGFGTGRGRKAAGGGRLPGRPLTFVPFSSNVRTPFCSFSKNPKNFDDLNSGSSDWRSRSSAARWSSAYITQGRGRGRGRGHREADQLVSKRPGPPAYFCSLSLNIAAPAPCALHLGTGVDEIYRGAIYGFRAAAQPRPAGLLSLPAATATAPPPPPPPSGCRGQHYREEASPHTAWSLHAV